MRAEWVPKVTPVSWLKSNIFLPESFNRQFQSTFTTTTHVNLNGSRNHVAHGKQHAYTYCISVVALLLWPKGSIHIILLSNNVWWPTVTLLYIPYVTIVKNHPFPYRNIPCMYNYKRMNPLNKPITLHDYRWLLAIKILPKPRIHQSVYLTPSRVSYSFFTLSTLNVWTRYRQCAVLCTCGIREWRDTGVDPGGGGGGGGG